MEQVKSVAQDLQQNGPEILEGMGNKLCTLLEQFGTLIILIYCIFGRLKKNISIYGIPGNEIHRTTGKQTAKESSQNTEESSNQLLTTSLSTELQTANGGAGSAVNISGQYERSPTSRYDTLLDDFSLLSTISHDAKEEQSKKNEEPCPQTAAETIKATANPQRQSPTTLLLDNIDETGIRNTLPVAQRTRAPLEPWLAASLTQMLAMGYANDDGWLTDLLRANRGDIDKVLEILHPRN